MCCRYYDCKHHGHADNVPLPHGTDAACMPEEAPGDVAGANNDMHGVFYHRTWYKHKHE